jgi:hypothetical protein
MAFEYHIAAVGDSNENEVSINLADVLNALGAQAWEIAIVVVTIAAVILLDSTWWLMAAIAAGLLLFAVYHHAEHRHSPYREGWG